MPSLNGFRGAPIERQQILGVAGEVTLWACRVCLGRATRNADAICQHCKRRGRSWKDDGKGLQMDIAEGVFK